MLHIESASASSTTPVLTADQELLARLQAGDERALADLSDAYSSKIYQLAFRYLRNKEDAEEITQDVLFKVYRKVDAFRGDAQLSSWIYRITFNAAMSRLRTARYQRAQAEDRRVAAAIDEDGSPSMRTPDSRGIRLPVTGAKSNATTPPVTAPRTKIQANLRIEFLFRSNTCGSFRLDLSRRGQCMAMIAVTHACEGAIQSFVPGCGRRASHVLRLVRLSTTERRRGEG